MIENLIEALPIVALIAAACAFLGWSIRGVANKPAHAKTSKSGPAPDAGKQDRVKNLEAALEKSKAANKELKAQIEGLQTASISKASFDSTTSELDAARKALETETKRSSTLEADLRKSQETIRALNTRVNEADKAQKDRSFALENELSKARQQLAQLENRPDESAALTVEIERLRESVATSTRFAGEMRKREAAAIEALEKAEARVAELSDPSRTPAAPKKIGPVVESNRIAAAKAEVLRLVEMNKQKEAAAKAVEPEAPVAEEPAPAVAEEIPVTEDAAIPSETEEALVERGEVAAPPEEEPAATENAPAPKKAVTGDLFALD